MTTHRLAEKRFLFLSLLLSPFEEKLLYISAPVLGSLTLLTFTLFKNRFFDSEKISSPSPDVVIDPSCLSVIAPVCAQESVDDVGSSKISPPLIFSVSGLSKSPRNKVTPGSPGSLNASIFNLSLNTKPLVGISATIREDPAKLGAMPLKPTLSPTPAIPRALFTFNPGIAFSGFHPCTKFKARIVIRTITA